MHKKPANNQGESKFERYRRDSIGRVITKFHCSSLIVAQEETTSHQGNYYFSIQRVGQKSDANV